MNVDADPQTVWRALTDPDQVSRWMVGTEVSSDWRVGSPITWRGEMDGRSYEDKGEILAVDEPTRLSMTHYSPPWGRPTGRRTTTRSPTTSPPKGTAPWWR